jgi:hypothetical protein
MKCLKQLDLACPFCKIGGSDHPMVVFSGFYESHEPPPSGDVRDIVRRIVMAIKTANKVGACFIIVELIVALVAAWAIRSK